MDESQLVIQSVLVLANFFLASFPLLAVGWGVMEITPGVAQASEIDSDVSSFIISLVFISAPALYSFLGAFIIFGDMNRYTTYKSAFMTLASSIVIGVGCGFSAYCLGKANRSLLVTKAKQKKFNIQFYLMNIFIEVVAILSLIIGFLHFLKS